jgi:hypothetical protein
MAKYEIQPTVVLKQNEVLNHLQRIGKVELPEFEPILGSENSFSIETRNFRF